MAGEWRRIALGNFVRLQRGHDLTQEERKSGTVPVMGSAGLSGYHDTARAPGPGVVIGRSGVGSMGAVHYCRTPFWPHNTTLYVTDFFGNDPRFAYFLLGNMRLRSYDSGSAQASLNRNFLYNIPLLIPPIEEQQTIGNILGTFDDKIDLLQRMSHTLEDTCQALFKEQFTNANPGHRAIGQQSIELSDLTAYLSRGLSPCYVELGGIPVINQKCIRDHRIDISKARSHDSSKKSTSGREVRVYDILVNSTGVGTLGRVAQVWGDIGPAIVDSHVTIVRPNSRVNPLWLGMALLNKEAEIERLGEGTTGQTELNRMRLGALHMLVPPREQQEDFARRIEPMLQRIFANDAHVVVLAKTRDTLIPKLLSGAIRIPDPARFMGDRLSL
jgi:type I restriction enzyme S subunit